MKITVYETFPENPSNPACTNMLTGEVEINKSAFDILPEHTKEFVLYHEIGHFKLQTSDETKATHATDCHASSLDTGNATQ